ncbi:MAG: PEGA domain-containing protein [Polyangia bacterium]|jgi:hypothetical protein
MVVLVLASGARAGEPRAAIAPTTVGQTAPPELERAFQDELPRALTASGFSLVPQNEIDVRVSERPEVLRCTAGGCLAEEASLFHVDQLILPRLELPKMGGGVTVGLSLYDAAQKRSIAEAVTRCSACTADRLRASVRAACAQLRASATAPGALEVATSGGVARLSVDGAAKGATPWHGPLAAGDHVVVLEAGGARVERDVSIAPGQTARLDVPLEIQKPAAQVARFRVIKWITLAAGLAAAGAGAGVWAIDGRPTCTLSGTQRQCPNLYDTAPIGAALVGVGGALLVTSVVMIALDHRAKVRAARQTTAAVALSPMAGGASLFAFGRF